MDLPKRYSYNPTARLFFFSVGAGAAWILVQRLSWGSMPSGFALGFGLLPIFMGVVLAARKLLFDRYVLLDSTLFTVPSGFLRLQTTQVPCAEIIAVWQSYLPYTGVIHITARQGKFEILSTMLPDSESYLTIGQFLYSKAKENQALDT